MIIDGYTIIFQMINFLILVFLLRHFLYGPIIETMDERETKIVERENEAAARMLKAGEKVRAYHRKTRTLQRQEEAFLERARASVEAQRGELLEEARSEVDGRRRSWQEALERERESFIDELRRRIGQQACSIARRCLHDLADACLEGLTWDLFLKRIEELPEEERSKLLEALVSDSNRITLRTAFEAPGEKVRALEMSLRRMLPGPADADLKISHETDPSLVCGLELEAGGYRVAWSVDGYLDGVQEKILKELDQAPAAEGTEEVSSGDPTEGGG